MNSKSKHLKLRILNKENDKLFLEVHFGFTTFLI